MKDDKGHGSNAHSTGIQSIGQEAHHWEKRPSGFGVEHRFMPNIPFAGEDSRNYLGSGSVMGNNRIGYSALATGPKFRIGSEQAPDKFKSVVAGKKWVEGRLKETGS